MTDALLGVVVFTGIVTCLAGLILLARSRVLPTGTSHVVVNDHRRFDAELGRKLLDALVAHGIALPSACGGKGTCGQCRVTVLGEMPPALPIDLERLSRKQLVRGERLACQLTLRDDIKIRIPDEILGIKRWICRVRSSRCVGTLLKEVIADLPDGETIAFRAGSFVQVTAPPYRSSFRDFQIDDEYRSEWDRLDFWRYEAEATKPTTRAYSLASDPGEDHSVMLLIRIATPLPGALDGAPPGIVSSYLFGLREGDSLEVSGPYGHFFATDSDREMIFLAGGAGMAPMRSHIFDQLLRVGSKRRISFWYGARNRRETLYTEEFDRLAREHENFSWTLALSEPLPDDEPLGEVGFIHEVLYRRYLADHPNPEECEYYLCGPPLMIRATCAILERLGVPPENVLFDDFGS